MICITVTPTSRTLVKADLLNAARHGDIIELCLDHFVNEPDVKDLITAVDKPMIVSCRRPQDGGKWKGTEQERLLLLRQAIVAGPAYIELDLDIADQIPRFGKTQRVISFTRLDRPETDIDGVFDAAANAKADIVKFAWPTPTLDAAWPLLAAVSQKRTLPVVGLGLGQAEITFSLLGMKYGSPWIYAALEQGMEAYPGQATVFDLKDIYHSDGITPKTAFVAVAGFGESQTVTTKVLNAGFQHLGGNVRCLPIELGDLRQLKKMLDVLKIRAIIVQGAHGQSLLELAEHVDKHDRQSGYLNLLLKRDDGWHGYNTLWRSSLKAVEAELQPIGKTLATQNVMVIGNGGMAQSMVHAITQRQGLVSVCGPDDKRAQHTAQVNNCRFVPFQNLYETLSDIVILADPQISSGTRHGQINPSLFRPNMTVLDVSNLPIENSLMQEARDRGSKVISSANIYMDQLNGQFKAVTGKDLPESAYVAGLAE
ncbi:type I 3-dehydroquinate dehydratase [Planctomicrobium piriforme]|nr:type I 3-dehydroquinate dehydratase [Planctomicrobium piriforme]